MKMSAPIKAYRQIPATWNANWNKRMLIMITKKSSGGKREKKRRQIKLFLKCCQLFKIKWKFAQTRDDVKW